MKENHTLNKTTNNQVHRILVLLLPSNLEETQEIASISSETETAEPGVKVQRNKMIGAPQDGTVLMIFCKYSNISFLSP